MKDYNPGLIRHRCSNAMRIGKPVKVHTKAARQKRKCPNCGKMLHVLVTDKYYLSIFLTK